MAPRYDWLARLLRHRPLTVELDQALERRLRAYMDRVNREMADPADCLDLDSDTDMASALLGAAEGGLEADERAHGLAST